MSDLIEFKSKEELYNRIVPALQTKVSELKRLGYKYINEKDIWNYLVNFEWKEKTDLELHNLVSDILYIDNDKLNEYVMHKINLFKNNEKDDNY